MAYLLVRLTGSAPNLPARASHLSGCPSRATRLQRRSATTTTSSTILSAPTRGPITSPPSTWHAPGAHSSGLRVAGIASSGVFGVRRRQLRWHSAPATPAGQSSSEACEHVTKVGAAANIGLCGIKAVGGCMSGSSALIADAFHSLGDLVSDAVTLAALRYSRDEPDEQFPFGKGKMESLGALSVSLLLVGTGVGIGNMAWVSLSSTAGVAIITGPAALICCGISVVVKEVLYRVTVEVGKRENSQVTVANAHHHRSDAYSSVVALAGIAGNMMGTPWMDPLCGGVVAAMILKTGYDIGHDALCDLTDKSTTPDVEILKAIHSACKEHSVKVDLKSIRCRQMGPYVSLYLTLHVKSTVSVSVAAQVSSAVKADIMRHCEAVQSCFITVAPGKGVDTAPVQGFPGYGTLKQQVLKVIEEKCPNIHSVTHFTPHYLSGHVSVNLEVTMDNHYVTTISEAASVARAAEREIMQTIPAIRHVDVHLELRGIRNSCEVFERLPSEESTPQPPVRRGGSASQAAKAATA